MKTLKILFILIAAIVGGIVGKAIVVMLAS